MLRPRLKKLHLLVLRAFAGPFAAGFSVSMFLLVLSILVKVQNEIFGKGFSLWTIANLFGYVALSQVVEALALGVLLSSLMTLGKLGENYELAALKASGISLFRVLRPLLLLGAGLCLGAFLFSFYIRPWANLKTYSLMYDLRKAKPSFALKPGLFNTLIDGYTIRATDRDADGLLRGIHIYDHSANGRANKVIVADSGRMEIDNRTLFLRMQLYSGAQYEEVAATRSGRANYPFTRIHFDTLNYKLDLSGWGLKRTDEDLFTNHQYMMTLPQLVHVADSVRRSPIMTHRTVRENTRTLAPVHRYLADSLAPLWAKPTPLPDSLARMLTQPSLQALQAAENNLRGLYNSLQFQEQALAQQQSNIRSYTKEMHLRFTLPLAVLLFLVIGASLGAIIRKGGLGAPVVVAIVLFAVFYALLTSGKNMAQEGVLPVWLAMWMPILVMLPLAVFLSYQSATDSPLLDLSAWRLLLGRWRQRWFGPRRQGQAS